ncbi:MAG: hypothetical protein AAGH71_03995 [Planctomycetota bacterium]
MPEQPAADNPTPAREHDGRLDPLDPSLPFRLTADDLLGDFLWPKLFRVPGLALRPGRIGLGVVALLVVMLLDQLLALVSEGGPVLTGLSAGAVRAWQPGGPAEAWALPAWRLVTVGVLALSAIAFVGVAIGRMVAEEFGRASYPTWPEALGWSVRSLPSILIAHLAPLIVIGIFIVVIAVGGWALLSVPFVNVLGAVLGVAAVAMSLLIVLLGGVYAVGFGMLSPAIACEGSDGVDAMQRVYALVLGRPGRFVLYTLVLAAQLAVVLAVVGGGIGLANGVAVWSMGLFLNDSAQLVAAGEPSGALGPGGRVAAEVMQTVLTLPWILLGGYVVAYAVAGWTVQYLLLRRSLDGQDLTDIHVPGEVEARVTEIMDRRGVDRAGDSQAPSSGEDPPA